MSDFQYGVRFQRQISEEVWEPVLFLATDEEAANSIFKGYASSANDIPVKDLELVRAESPTWEVIATPEPVFLPGTEDPAEPVSDDSDDSDDTQVVPDRARKGRNG